MRTCHIKIDKTKDTDWPPASVNQNGVSYSLVDIYKKAGIQLLVRRGDTDLAIPATGSDFDLAQLHSLMVDNKQNVQAAWAAHILIVPNIRYTSSWQIRQSCFRGNIRQQTPG